MPYDQLKDYPAELLARAAAIKLACFDVDGTLTDGRLWYDDEGRELKAFSVTDGMGLKLLEQSGITVALITARQSGAAQSRGRELGIKQIHVDVKNKRVLLQKICSEMGITTNEASFMGDDLPDLPAMLCAGLSVSPDNAHAWIKSRVHWRTAKSGGDGAVRELCDLLLAAQNKAQAIIEAYSE